MATAKVRQVIRRLEAEGWELARMRGSHRVFKHPMRPRRVIVAGNLNDELAVGTYQQIKRDAGWT